MLSCRIIIVYQDPGTTILLSPDQIIPMHCSFVSWNFLLEKILMSILWQIFQSMLFLCRRSKSSTTSGGIMKWHTDIWNMQETWSISTPWKEISSFRRSMPSWLYIIFHHLLHPLSGILRKKQKNTPMYWTILRYKRIVSAF